MPARDRRTLGELLADSEVLAREILFDVSPEQAPAMARTWGPIIQATAQLWASLPADPTPEVYPQVMARLYALGRGIGRTTAAGGWPGPGPHDARMLKISVNLAQAAVAVQHDSHGRQAGLLAGWAEVRSAPGRLVHILYVAAHGMSVTVNAYRAELDQRLQFDSHRRRPRVNRPEAAQVAAARDLVARLDVFDQIAGDWVATHPAGPTRAGDLGPRPPAMSRLESALAGWDIQAHRTLAATVDIPDLIRVARVQALIAAATRVVTEAAAHHGLADRAAVARLTPFMHQTEAAWTRSARRWGELASTASRTDPALIRAAGEVRAAVPAATCTPTGWASPDQLAGRLDLTQTVQTVHLANASAVDVAYLGREVAATARLTTTAHARLIPLHGSVRRELVDLAADVIAASGQAAAAAAPIQASTASHRPAKPPGGARPPARPVSGVVRPGVEGPRR